MRAVLTLLLMLLATGANAQVIPKLFSFYSDSDGADNCTVQKPTGQTTAVTTFKSATFYCEQACTIELEVGTATALDTSGSIVSMSAGTSVNEAFCSSEVAQGSTIYKYSLAATDEKSINLTNFVWPATSGGRTLTFRISAGLSRRNIVWQESP